MRSVARETFLTGGPSPLLELSIGGVPCAGARRYIVSSFTTPELAMIVDRGQNYHHLGQAILLTYSPSYIFLSSIKRAFLPA